MRVERCQHDESRGGSWPSWFERSAFSRPVEAVQNCVFIPTDNGWSVRPNAIGPLHGAHASHVGREVHDSAEREYGSMTSAFWDLIDVLCRDRERRREMGNRSCAHRIAGAPHQSVGLLVIASGACGCFDQNALVGVNAMSAEQAVYLLITDFRNEDRLPILAEYYSLDVL